MSNHTKGPWFVDGDQTLDNGNLVGVYVANDLGGRIGQTFSNCMASDSECRANARLIAAAPELLEAAKLVLAWYEAEEDFSKEPDFYKRVAMCKESEDAIRAAIAKATGEQA